MELNKDLNASPVLKCSDLPEPEGSIIEFITAEDRRHFEEHPQARFYDRAPHPSELWPVAINTLTMLVRVYQVWPGFRIRCPYPKGGKPGETAIKIVKRMRKAHKRGDLKECSIQAGAGNLHFVAAVE